MDFQVAVVGDEAVELPEQLLEGGQERGLLVEVAHEELAHLEVVAVEGERRPLVVADGSRALGVIYLKDIVKGGIKERFSELRRMGIKTVMVTGDNTLTAATIAREAGVDDFVAESKIKVE